MPVHVFEQLDGNAILKHWDGGPVYVAFCAECNRTHSLSATREWPVEKLKAMFVSAADRITNRYRTWERITHAFASVSA